MQPTLDNKILTSFLLHLDYKIQSMGSAFQNYSGVLTPTVTPINNLYAYSTPFKPWCNDISISGANVMSGVYLNNHFVTVGQSGLAAINHYQGTVYFNSPLPTNTVVTASYAIKDFTIELTDQPEQKLIFLTKYLTNNQYAQNPTGLTPDTKTYPIIFLKTKVQDSKPFALGGVDESTIRIRGIIIADNEFKKIAVSNIITSLNYRPLPYIASTPFDSMGNMTGINYSYPQLAIDPTYKPWIFNIKVIDVPIQGEFKDIVKNMCMVDVLVSTIKSHDF